MATHFHNIRKHSKKMKELIEINDGKWEISSEPINCPVNDKEEKTDSEDDEEPSVHTVKEKEEESSSKSDNEEEKDGDSDDEASDSGSDQSSILGKRSRTISFSSQEIHLWTKVGMAVKRIDLASREVAKAREEFYEAFKGAALTIKL